MKKESYERTELEVFEFQTEDVICESKMRYEDMSLTCTESQRWRISTARRSSWMAHRL